MKKTTSRRTFLGNSLMATAGLAYLSSATSLKAFSGDDSPFKGYNPFADAKTDLREYPFGEHLEVFGKIYDASGEKPLPNAKVEVWHLSPNSEKFRHRAKLTTNENGEYHFVTDKPNRELGKHYKVFFRVSQDGETYFTELSFNNTQAFISSKHWEKNNQLGEDRLFPTKTSFLNHSKIQFNIAINTI